MVTEKYKCLACGSTDLCFGYQGTAANVFVPSGVFTFHGFKTRTYVCLRCGQMGHFMAKDKLEKLRAKLKTIFDSPFE
jgi:DNA-directed RNA polymerase subunit RPC12/RpoP